MLKSIAKAAFCLLCLATLTGLRCQNSLLNPQPAASEGISPQTLIASDSRQGTPGNTDCRLQVNRTDSTLIVEIEDSRERSTWIWDNIVRIEYRVPMGLADKGMVLANKAGFISLENMSKTTRVAVKMNGPIPAGKNQVLISSVLRYLDGSGHLALPIRRTGFYCYLQW